MSTEKTLKEPICFSDGFMSVRSHIGLAAVTVGEVSDCF